MSGNQGYSGKPLAAKLGFKPGFRVGLVDAPDSYASMIGPVDGVLFQPATGGAGFNVIHLFLHRPEDIAAGAAQAIAGLREGGALWLSWAKKTSPQYAGITEDMLRNRVLPLGWVDVKVCAVDADWSGLKFLKRR